MFFEMVYFSEGTSPFCSPVKVLGGTKFKKSLSFGGTTTSTPRPPIKTPPIGRHSTVLARPCNEIILDH